MIDTNTIEQQVNISVDEFKQSFPNCTYLDGTKKDIFLEQICNFLNEKKFFKQYEEYMQKTMIEALGLTYAPNTVAKQPGETGVSYLIRKFGAEIGSIVALTIKTINRVIVIEGNAFAQKYNLK